MLVSSYLPAIAVGISTCPNRWLLQLLRADPSAAPDKVFVSAAKLPDEYTLSATFVNVLHGDLDCALVASNLLAPNVHRFVHAEGMVAGVHVDDVASNAAGKITREVDGRATYV